MTKESGKAEARYNQLQIDRTPFIQTGKECARYTVPALTPEPWTAKRRLRTPYQGVGARGVNNLASKLLLTAFPPNTSFFKLQPDVLAVEEEEAAQQQQMLAEIDQALGKVERAVMSEIETSGDRPVMFAVLRHLIINGNCLLYVGEDGSQLYSLNRYVVQRDPMGNLLEIVIHEQVAPASLDPKVLASLKDGARYKTETKRKGSQEKTLNIYTHIERKDGVFEFYQECMGQTIPGSPGTAPLDALPWMPLRFTYVEGEDYGRSHVEEYLGDLVTLEGLTKAIKEGSAAAAKLLILVEPNSTTRAKTIAEAPNGAVREGSANDVTVVQMDKFADFRTALETMQMIERRLEHAFLLNTSIQRSGERVTAEEIRFMAQDLEDALGGVYSSLSQELQAPYVRVRMRMMERSGRMPSLPHDIVKPMITTGLDALGRGHDRSKLVGFSKTIADVFGPQALPQFIHPEELVKRLATADGIHPDGLVKDAEEAAQEQGMAQLQQALQSAGPEAGAALAQVLGTSGVPGVPANNTPPAQQ